jgi:hypothetical protein
MYKTAQSFIDAIGQEYELVVNEKEGGNQFVSRTVVISDPRGNGLNIELYVNDNNEFSVFDTHEFIFSRFNIAEGYSQKDIMEAVGKVLSGDVSLKRSLLGRLTLHIKTNSGKIVGKQRSNSTCKGSATVQGYTKRTSTNT